jgi:uncharacterized protein
LRVVLDSSVLIAAAISRAGTCAAVLEDVLAHHEPVLSEYILPEVQRKLRDKLGYPARDIRLLLRLLRHSAELVVPTELNADACRDPKVIPVLGTAVAGAADLLISGDQHLLVLQRFRAIRILTPSRFWSFAQQPAQR